VDPFFVDPLAVEPFSTAGAADLGLFQAVGMELFGQCLQTPAEQGGTGLGEEPAQLEQGRRALALEQRRHLIEPAVEVLMGHLAYLAQGIGSIQGPTGAAHA